jgi:hypothetical protein
MASRPPKLVALDHDEFHAKWVGRLVDGRQFFGSFPFVPYGPSFVALYLFDAEGEFVEARIDEVREGDGVDAETLLDRWVAELGPVTFGRIEMAPFQFERFGITFGLLPRTGERDGGWWAVFHPGNYMAFNEPWNGGDYST